MKSIPQRYICTFLILLATAFAFFSVQFLYNKGMVIIVEPSSDVGSRRDQTQTLLITFGRSGSSFTSDIIAHHKDVFYTYEPLSFLSRTLEANRVPVYFQTAALEDFSKRVIESFLTCRFDVDTMKSLNNKHLAVSNSTKDFISCFKQRTKSGIAHLDCYFKLVQKCSQHAMKLVKTIRFPVKWAEDLMHRNPNLKIIYLIRDPRATLLSQALVLQRFQLPKDMANASSLHCDWLNEDLVYLQRLRDHFPDRVKVVRYEHGAIHPTQFAEEIYRFLGLPITQELMDFVERLTSPGKKRRHNEDNKIEVSKENINKQQLDSKKLEAPDQSKEKAGGEQGSVDSQAGNLNDRKRLGLVAMVKESESTAGSQGGQKSKKPMVSNVQSAKASVNKSQNSLGSNSYSTSTQVTTAPRQDKGKMAKQAAQHQPDTKAVSTSVARGSPEVKNSRSKKAREKRSAALKRKKVYIAFSTHRDNPRRAMEHWRYQLGIKMTRVVDAHCGHLYPQLGYKRVTTQRDLEDTAHVHLVTEPLIEGII